MHFAVRSLQSPSGLDGAFRVHLLPEHLEQVGLRVGDVCEITGDDDGESVLGYGIAWRATDKMGSHPKQRPAKMTDLMRVAFNIKEGSHVNVGPTKAKIGEAVKVVLSDVTPTEYATSNGVEPDDKKWYWRCGYSLVNCEAFASGVTFDVTAKKGIRKRFYVESVEAKDTSESGPRLFSCNDKTKIVFADSDHTRSPSPADGYDKNGSAPHVLTTARIGGLTTQIHELNKSMRSFLAQSQSTTSSSSAGAILIHGYEGTGKSLMLEQMETLAFRKVVRIQKSKLDAVTVTRNKAAITAKFDEALQVQPSLVLIDDLDQLAPSSGDLYSENLVNCLRQVAGTRTVVVAACRNPNDVYQKLIGPHYFRRLIEFSIPDQAARKQILYTLINRDHDPEGRIATNVSLRSHGFTGKDLAWLVLTAQDNAEERCWAEAAKWARRPSHSVFREKFLDGTAYSQAALYVEQEQQGPPSENELPTIIPRLTIEDFDHALTKIRPTALREVFIEKPRVQWSDIGGSGPVRQRFDKIIGWPFHHPEKLDRFRFTAQRGVLLYGPPGCSKTLTAQAVATTYDLNFIAVQGAELISMYVGESERAVREIFRKARAAAPCVIFFDEIDSIAAEREGSGTKGLNVLTTLLNEMDGFQSLKGVLVLAATNKPDILDPAIMRPGRFDTHLYLGPPNVHARKEIFEMQLEGLLADAVDIEFFADATEGYTGAEIVGICRAAKESALSRDIDREDGGYEMVEEHDLEVALRGAKKAVTAQMLAGYQAFAQD